MELSFPVSVSSEHGEVEENHGISQDGSLAESRSTHCWSNSPFADGNGFAGMFARGGHLIVAGDAAATAWNILGHERRFRVGLVCEFGMLNCDVVLALALFALLRPVNFTLALLGSFWRAADAFVLAIGIAASLGSLDLLNDPHTAALVSLGQLHGTAMLMFFNLHKQVSLMGLMFFCLGAGVHSWLLFRSRYIPRVISGLYLFASAEMLLCCIAFMVFPKSRAILDPGFVVPDFFAELAAALWLTLKGVKLSTHEGRELHETGACDRNHN